MHVLWLRQLALHTALTEFSKDGHEIGDPIVASLENQQGTA